MAGLPVLTVADTTRIAGDLLGGNKRSIEVLKNEGSADVSYSVPHVGRFRVNIFRQRGTYAIVMRVIPHTIPSLQELMLPPQLADIAALKNGIVLVTGPTGSGKSSTLAAIIRLINEAKAYHIVTIEDPIEFMHPHNKSTIHQRELHADTSTFALALRAALRQAPKVILVGEMRDKETIEIAMMAAETGHLVFSTLHTIDASKTVERIIGEFPITDQGSGPQSALAVVPLHRLAASAAEKRRQGAHRRHRGPEIHHAHPRIYFERRGRRPLARGRDGRRQS